VWKLLVGLVGFRNFFDKFRECLSLFSAVYSLTLRFYIRQMSVVAIFTKLIAESQLPSSRQSITYLTIMIRPQRTALACCLCAVILLQMPVEGIVIRHDVPDSEYRVSASAFPALAYLPGEGHGVLIAKDWVATAAHATTWRTIHELTINGTVRSVGKIIVHPGYKRQSKDMRSEDAAPLMAFLAGSDDIALIKLQHAVSDVTPISVYKGSDENGKVVEIVGAGSTGNGLVGEYPGFASSR